jgi:hypothetical protein
VRARRRYDPGEVRRLRQQLRTLTRGTPDDPGFRRLRYTRYADDHLLGFIGPKAEAEAIKARLARFLREDLKLDLSPDKTLITHGRTAAARFLGYEITVQHSDHKTTNGRRSVNGKVALRVPRDVIKAKAAPYMKFGKPERRPDLLNLTDTLVISSYGAQWRGYLQYYLLAQDVWRLNRLQWVMLTSMLKTLAGKAPLDSVEDGPHLPGHHRHSARATGVLPSQRRTPGQATTGDTVRWHPPQTAEESGPRRPSTRPGHRPTQRQRTPRPPPQRPMRTV